MNTLCRIAHRSLHLGIAFSWDGCAIMVFILSFFIHMLSDQLSVLLAYNQTQGSQERSRKRQNESVSYQRH